MMSCIYCGGENCGSSAGGPSMCNKSRAAYSKPRAACCKPRAACSKLPEDFNVTTIYHISFTNTISNHEKIITFLNGMDTVRKTIDFGHLTTVSMNAEQYKQFCKFIKEQI